MNNKIKSKKAQEEIVGFALIMIIVAVVILVFLGFSISNSKKQNLESYEVESFLSSALKYTTECQDAFGYKSLRSLVFYCYERESCGGEDSCEILNETVAGMLQETWPIEEDKPVIGYEMLINSGEEVILSLKEGNVTGNSKGSRQDFSRAGDLIEISLTVYY